MFRCTRNFVIYCLLSSVQFCASTPLGNEIARNKHKGKKQRAKDEMRLWQIKQMRISKRYRGVVEVNSFY